MAGQLALPLSHRHPGASCSLSAVLFTYTQVDRYTRHRSGNQSFKNKGRGYKYTFYYIHKIRSSEKNFPLILWPEFCEVYLFIELFHDTLTDLHNQCVHVFEHCMPSNTRITVNDELEMRWMEVIVAYFIYCAIDWSLKTKSCKIHFNTDHVLPHYTK
jgi:hypothetical protein